jgi:hypothetical protein
MSAWGNGWVRFLRNYGPIPTNDNMYDETIQRALRRLKIRPLELSAQYLDAVLENLRAAQPRSVILTGTAGDGKTYHCREAWVQLGGSEDAWNGGDMIQRLALGTRELVVVKDLSELRTEDSHRILQAVADDLVASDPARLYLIAANHGQLIDRLQGVNTENARNVTAAVEDLMVTRKIEAEAFPLVLYDLSRAPAADMIGQVIDAMTGHEGWETCTGCPQADGAVLCPIRENRRRLMGAEDEGRFRRRLGALVEISELNGGHFPIRQQLALVANILLGHPQAPDGLMRCADAQQIAATSSLDGASVYRNVFGDNLKASRAEKTDVFRKLGLFGIGGETSNRVDNLLVYGADDPVLAPDYQSLVECDPVYGATTAYQRAQRAYLEGEDLDSRDKFLDLLRAQRQRLFFTLPEDQIAKYALWDLTVYRYAGEYLTTARNLAEGRVPPKVMSLIVRGLNRIFTGLLLQNNEDLILATSGSHAQSKTSSLLDEIISVPRTGGQEVTLAATASGPFEVIVRLARGADPGPIRFSLSPTRFEFLGRVSEGALPSSFSLECHEDLLAFKARLLAASQRVRALDAEDGDQRDDEIVLRFIDVSDDGRASPRRVAVRI